MCLRFFSIFFVFISFYFFICCTYYFSFARSFCYRCSFNCRSCCCWISCCWNYSVLSNWSFYILSCCWNWCSIFSCWCSWSHFNFSCCRYYFRCCRSYFCFSCYWSYFCFSCWSHLNGRNYLMSSRFCDRSCSSCYLLSYRNWCCLFSCCYCYSSTKYASYC